MQGNTAVIRVGRLLEVRVNFGYRTRADVDYVFDQIDHALLRIGLSQRVVTVVDWRRCPVMAADAAQRMVERILLNNARTERSAVIAGASAPTAVLQFVRLIREARSPDRKMFFDETELVTWLSESLTALESLRLRRFVDENHADGVDRRRSARPADVP